MLVIRLKPVGKKKQISFRVVVGEKRSKLNGRFVEDLGFYNPHSNSFNLNNDRVKYWISSGAQPSDTVYNVFIKAGLIEGSKRPTKTVKPKEVPQENKPQEQAKPVDQKIAEEKPEQEKPIEEQVSAA